MTATAFRAQVPLRWTDQDAYRHLNHAKAVTLLEEARIELCFAEAARCGVGGFAAGLLVVGLHVDSLAQVTYAGHTLAVELTVDELRAASFRLHYRLHAGPDVGPSPAIVAWTRMATFDLVAGRLRRMDDSEREFLGRWTA